MDYGTLRQGMSCMPGRMRALGGQWASAQCVQKVEEMLCRSIIHQEDLWDMLEIHSPKGVPLDMEYLTGKGSKAAPGSEAAISPQLLKALKAKLENSMDWCHLALCRLKEIISHTSTSTYGPENVSVAGFYVPRTPSAAPIPSTKLNLPSPLHPLRVPLSREHLAPSHPFTVPRFAQSVWSPGSLFFHESPQIPASRNRTENGEQLQEQSMQGLLVPDGERLHQQGQNFSRLSSQLGLESDWSMLSAEAHVSGAPPRTSGRPAAAATLVEAHQSSTASCHMHLDASYCMNDAGGKPAATEVDAAADQQLADKGADAEGRSFVSTKGNIARGLRSKRASGPKRDREATAEEDTTVSVAFQQLKPGRDARKGIPDDGHRGWKKYGNKAIQNSNFCRGYYKCTVKECRAKKMVQPTDKNPSIFEVTYVGKHTCSSSTSSQRRNQSQTAALTRASAAQLVHIPAERPQSTADNDAAHMPTTTSTAAPGGNSPALDVAVVSLQSKVAARLLKTHGGRSHGFSEVEETCSQATTRSTSTEGSEEEEEDLVREGAKSWPSSSCLLQQQAGGVENGPAIESKQKGASLPHEDPEQDGTYVHPSSVSPARHQSVYTFQADPAVLWPEINMDSNLPLANHNL